VEVPEKGWWLSTLAGELIHLASACWWKHRVVVKGTYKLPVASWYGHQRGRQAILVLLKNRSTLAILEAVGVCWVVGISGLE